MNARMPARNSPGLAIAGKRFKRITNRLALAGVGTLALIIGCGLSGARINKTPSLAVGLYWAIDAPVKKGAYVVFCPPQIAVVDEARQRGYFGAGFCPGGYQYLMKRVLATGGDVVSIDAAGVSVNGTPLPLSEPMNVDPAGRPVRQARVGSFILADSEVLLMSDVSAQSFDSRYFGAVDRMQVKSVVRPVITW